MEVYLPDLVPGAPIGRITVPMQKDWATFSIALPQSGERVRFARLTFKVTTSGEVLLRHARHSPEVNIAG